MPNNDLANMPIGSDLQSECEASCNSASGCVAYVFNKQYKKCFLKNAAGTLFQNDTAYTGYTSTNGEQPKFSLLKFHDKTAQIGTAYGSPSNIRYVDCALDCDKDFACIAFNYDFKFSSVHYAPEGDKVTAYADYFFRDEIPSRITSNFECSQRATSSCSERASKLSGARVRAFVFKVAAIALMFLLVAAPAGTETSIALNCTPIAQQGPPETDPIEAVEVRVSGRDWRVTHIAASGNRYERAQQYSIRDTSAPTLPVGSGTIIATQT